MKNQLRTLAGIIMILLTVVGGASPATAEEPRGNAKIKGERERIRQPVYRRFQRNLRYNHDRGLFLRVGGGVGYGSRDMGATVQGIGVMPQIAAGWMPVEATAIHLSGWGLLGQDVVTLGVGPGVTHYFDPQENIWISVQLGPVTADLDGRWWEQWALGGELEAGLFGWTGARFSMGGSLFGGIEGIDLDGDNRQISGWRLGIRVGVVYN